MSSNPVSRAEVAAFVRDTLAQILEIDAESMTETDRFAEDLALDSLALIEFVEEVEAEYGERTVGFHIDDEELAEFTTVREAVDFIVGRIG